MSFIDKSDLTETHEHHKDFELELSESSLLSTYSGVGKAQNVTEYGEGYFFDNNINVSNNENATVIIPDEWKAEQLQVDITELLEYDKKWINDSFDSGYDSKYWSNFTNRPQNVTFGWYDAPSGNNDSIYIRFEDANEGGTPWNNKISYWNYTFSLPREQIPFEDWIISFNYRVVYSDPNWLTGIGGASNRFDIIVNEQLEPFTQTKLNLLENNTWYQDSVVPFKGEQYNFMLPGAINLIFGINFGNSGINPTGFFEIYYDNITLQLSTLPNPSQIGLNITDLTNGQNKVINDASDPIIGTVELYNIWTGATGGTTHYFSFTHNSSAIIILSSVFHSKVSSSQKTETSLRLVGSDFSVENDTTTTWTMYVPVSIPGSYSSNYYLNVSKPLNWNVTQVIDPYSNNKIDEVVGAGVGNSTLTIPNNIITEGVWKIVAEAPNYVELANLLRKDGSLWGENDTFHVDDELKINATIKLIPNIDSTSGMLKIFSPNGSLWYQEGNVSVNINGNVEFSKITLGTSNASTGKYSAQIIWHDNNVNISQVGFPLLQFNVIHRTNLTAIESYFNLLSGDPLLLRVKFWDYDFNKSIPFATITYNSTFGMVGSMIYQGLGIYFIDVDTSSLLIGDYYFSFNASKSFYENKTMENLIHLKITGQPLELEVPHYTLEGNANNIISCKINTTGAITGSLITTPVNISTDWFNPYNITDHYNGTYTLDFSTNNIPTSGYLESYNIEIFANKTNYGNTNEFITLLVHPISTEASVNISLASINSNEVVNLKVNYTIEGSSELIIGSNCTVTWQGSSLISPVSDGFDIKLFTFGLQVDYYFALIKLEKAGFEDAFESVTIIINEQDVNLTVSINSEGISANSLIESYFQQTINISARAYAVADEEFLSGGMVTLISNNFEKNFTEIPSTYFSTSLILDGVNFISGINNIYLRFEQANYTTTIFPFQLYLSSQDVNLTVSLNSEGITANSFIESYFQQTINISVRAYAVMDKVFLSGGMVTLISNNFEKNFTEIPSTYFFTSLILDGVNFIAGINNIFLRFEQTNYTTNTFTFQLFIKAQNVNLTTLINNQEIREDYLIERSFNEEFQISCRAFADIESVFLSGGSISFINGEYEVELFENAEYWFNRTILISTSSFSIGPNYAYIKFQQNNYTTTIFTFQVFVNQIEINVDTPDFEGLISGAPGETVSIRLNLTETGSTNYIENATVFYSWNFGVGYFDDIGSGIYELELSLPTEFGGSFDFELIISKEGILYKTKEYTFFVDINQVEGPNLFIWIIIFALIAVSGILGVLSLRSYVILPKRRKKEAELISKIQVFQDVWNTRAVILIHRESGLPIYSEEISINEKDQDSTLISGFVQAITAFSETFIGKEFETSRKLATDYEYLRTIIDLDFRFFQLLVCDFETVRILLILRDTASERLKKQLYLLATVLHSQFGNEFINFSGNLQHITMDFQEFLNQFLFLHYNREFEITPNKNYYDSLFESEELTTLERRLINVIISMTKINKTFIIKEAIDLIEEKNEDLILEAFITLIQRKIIISPYFPKLKQKK